MGAGPGVITLPLVLSLALGLPGVMPPLRGCGSRVLGQRDVPKVLELLESGHGMGCSQLEGGEVKLLMAAGDGGVDTLPGSIQVPDLL